MEYGQKLRVKSTAPHNQGREGYFMFFGSYKGTVLLREETADEVRRRGYQTLFAVSLENVYPVSVG